MTQAEGFAVDCKAAPTAITLGLGMFGVAPQTLDVSKAGADAGKAYVFAFDPGDLGRSALPTCRCISTAMRSR